MNLTDILEEIKEASPEIIYKIERRLDEWGAWFIKIEKEKLDYMPHSNVYSMMTYGPLPPEKSGPRPLPVNEDAEEIEAIVSLMATKYKGCEFYALALREYYVGQGRLNVVEAAKEMGMSERNFRPYIKGAFLWLYGWFTREYAERLLK